MENHNCLHFNRTWQFTDDKEMETVGSHDRLRRDGTWQFTYNEVKESGGAIIT